MDLKKLFLIVLLILSAFSLKAINIDTIIVFEHLKHDFGKIHEEKGPVLNRFSFINNGSKPFVITEVKASCGCTTPSWTKDTIMPDQEGYITARFNPYNRPGAFEKYLYVKTNLSSKKIKLKIKGVVIPRQRTPADDYPEKMGNIRLLSRYLSFGTIKDSKTIIRKFDVYNTGKEPVKFYNTQFKTPSYLKVEVKPDSILPGNKGYIKIKYNAEEKNNLGHVNDLIKLPTNDPVDSVKSLYVSATIHQDFSGLTLKEKENAPRIKFESKSHNFGEISQKEKVTTHFKFTNTGKSALRIKKVKSSCGCTASFTQQNVIEPDESGKIKIEYDPAGKTGSHYQTVKVFCNDPLSPRHQLKIKAKIRK